jgi:hypothetical protein
MQRYDPDEAPDAEEWLALDEQERIELVRDYHRAPGLVNARSLSRLPTQRPGIKGRAAYRRRKARCGALILANTDYGSVI